MRKHESGQKKRQLDRMSLEERVCTEVREVASKPFVLLVEDHFAGYFNELGLTVIVIESASDSDVIILRNELLQHLESRLRKGTSPFSWQVAFQRDGQTIEVLFPGDEHRETTDELKPS
jgi:hypothetical protein